MNVFWEQELYLCSSFKRLLRALSESKVITCFGDAEGVGVDNIPTVFLLGEVTVYFSGVWGYFFPLQMLVDIVLQSMQ